MRSFPENSSRNKSFKSIASGLRFAFFWLKNRIYAFKYPLFFVNWDQIIL